MGAGSVKQKGELLEEIRSLIHIGRSAHDIEQELSTMGYDKYVLREILNRSFMETLIQKEQRFIEVEQAAYDQARERADSEEQEALRRKNQAEQAERQNMQEALVRQNEKQIQDAVAEKSRSNFEEQRAREEDQLRLEAAQQQGRQRIEEEDRRQKHEAEMRLF